ncbi:MAG: hypothetical protein EXR74_00160 [Bdellovibrionales bacterium]|nr:hypothetical protein [Bdellovibrionales bacterium]
MKLILLVSCLLFSIFSAPSFSIDNPPTEKTQLTELFSSQESPGEGTLVYSGENEKDTITLGVDSGIYALALAFKGELLPISYRKDFAKKIIIQVALGNLKSKLGDKIPQFGVASFITSEIPKEATAFTFMDLKKKNIQPQAVTILQFISPKTTLAQSDQEKLQNTFYGKSGGITMTPVGEIEQVTVRTTDGKVTFKKQKMKFDFQTTMMTPFSGLEKKLVGSIIFPVYVPFGKRAEALAVKLGSGVDGADSGPPKRLNPNRKITGTK